MSRPSLVSKEGKKFAANARDLENAAGLAQIRQTGFRLAVHHYPELKQADGGTGDLLVLAHRRWFAIGLCVLSIAVGALTFSLGFPQTGPAQSAHVVSHIFMGPFCQASYFPWFTSVPQVLIPWASVLLLLSHPVFPRPFTVVTTLIGGGLWWLMGWYCIAAVA